MRDLLRSSSVSLMPSSAGKLGRRLNRPVRYVRNWLPLAVHTRRLRYVSTLPPRMIPRIHHKSFAGAWFIYTIFLLLLHRW